MNRPLLFAALAVSLVGNAWFLIAAGPRPAPASPLQAPAPTAPPPAKAAAVDRAATKSATTASTDAQTTPTEIAPRGFTWRAPRSDDDFRTLVNHLRAAGVPTRLIYTVLRELYTQQALARSPLATAPFWQRSAIEQSKEMQDAYRQMEEKVREFMGPDARLSARLDPVQRARRYGDLPDAKIDAIAEIERDYQDMRSDIYRTTGSGGFTSEEWAAQQKQTNLLKDEQRADLAKILTPAELVAYDLRNSDAARQVANSVREIALTPDEFAAIYAARQAFDVATPPITGMISGEQMQKRREAQAAYTDAVQGVFNDDRFYQYLAGTDADYRAVLNLSAQFSQVTPTVSYQVSQLKREMEQARTTVLRNSQSFEAVQAAYAGWNARLDTLLGAPAAAAYRATQSGRVFSAPVMRRATPTSGTTPPRG